MDGSDIETTVEHVNEGDIAEGLVRECCTEGKRVCLEAFVGMGDGSATAEGVENAIGGEETFGTVFKGGDFGQTGALFGSKTSGDMGVFHFDEAVGI